MHPASPSPGLTLADVVRRFAPAYALHHALAGFQRRALSAIAACRTPALGGQRYLCPACGHEEVRFHSCGNRHCPRCQALAKERWVAAQVAQTLPVEHFHVVFTLPHGVNVLAPSRVVDGLLFACAAGTLLDFARNPRWLGAEPAITAVLHTWDQQLRVHRHVHCLVSGGGLSPAGLWVAAKPHFLFPVRALSRVFRGRFMAALDAALAMGRLRLPSTVCRADWAADLLRQDWVVYAKPPFAGPAQVLAYLGRYTHRTAIGEHRLLDMDTESVRFRWRDRAHGNRVRVLALPGETFLGRFLCHVLPKGFQRIRHFGLLANRVKGVKLAQARAALDLAPSAPVPVESVVAFAWRVWGVDVRRCPACGEAHLRWSASLPPARGPPGYG